MKTITTAFLFLLLTSLNAFSAFNGASIIQQIQKDTYTGSTPVAVFDLDETLIYSHQRKLASFKEAAQLFTATHPFFVGIIEKMTLKDFMKTQNHYDSNEIFKANGINDNAFVKELELKMLPIYLSKKYMDYDTEIPCATAFIRSLYSNGAMVVFISSRYKSTQSKGTIESLTRLRIIRPGDHFRIILRPDGMSSIDFKKMAFNQVLSMKKAYNKPTIVRVVGENEPENMNAMIQTFPNAARIFVRGANLSHDKITAPVQFIPNYCN